MQKYIVVMTSVLVVLMLNTELLYMQ